MIEPPNRYAPPSTHVEDHETRPDPNAVETFVPNGRTLPPGRGAAWIADAWRLLKAEPAKWALAVLLILVFYIVVSLIPLVNIVASLAGPFVTAGVVLAADEQRRTGTFDIATLFSVANRNPASLLAVAGIMLLLFIGMAVVIGLSIGMQLMLGNSHDLAMLLSPGFLLTVLLCLAIALPVSAAAYLAPPLIVLHNVPALTAMKMSLIGVARNILSGLVFGLCALGLTLLALIPLGLGLLIVIPIMIITTYTVYRDIFIEPRPG